MPFMLQFADLGDKKLKIGMGVAGAAVVAVLAMSMFGGRVGGGGKGVDVTFICINPQCGQQYTLPASKASVLDDGSDYAEQTGKPAAYECTHCKQRSAYWAEQCPKCKAAFLAMKAKRAPSGGPLCPQCGADVRALRTPVKKKAPAAK